MGGELGDQPFRPRLLHDQLHRLLGLERRDEQPVRHALLQRVRHPDHEPPGSGDGTALERVLQLPTEA